MGIYLNPGNELFKMAINSEIYVDKSMLIDITNRYLSTQQRNICMSRPRRFGKSMTANMLVAYYSRGCDSKELFKGLKIEETKNFEKHLNKYNVISLNIADFVQQSDSIDDMVLLIENEIIEEIEKDYPDFKIPQKAKLPKILQLLYIEYKIPFVFIIDEWDCVYRFFKDNDEENKKYLDFLRALLKDKSYVALNYATGILPVKKYGQHSALNMYDEYSMAEQSLFAEYTGFTDIEVRNLCDKYNMSFDDMKKWYDGYKVEQYEIYNPRSVVASINNNKFSNYWTKTETFEALAMYIKLDMDGLKEKVTTMIAGESVDVDTITFANDMVTFKTADDVLTLLIHLGYLTYDADTKMAWIPNNEVRDEFRASVKTGGYDEVLKSIKLSDELLKETRLGNAQRVAEIIEEVHQYNTSIIAYNNELSLSVTLSLAYYSARNDYEIFKELPTGKGYADLTFIPRKNVDAPAMVIELKYNKNESVALNQIKAKNYTEKLKAFSGEILLVGISYDDNKGHKCVIEKINK